MAAIQMISGYSKNPSVLMLGDPRLHAVSQPLQQNEIAMVDPIIKQMHDILMAYRKEYGKFRAIAAPQLGVLKRIVYMCIDKPVIIINPSVTPTGVEMIEAWDDCMSFPDLLVRIRRHRFCTMEYVDLEWRKCTINASDDMAGLLQHEFDHLEGILAVQRAIDDRSFSVFLKKGKHG